MQGREVEVRDDASSVKKERKIFRIRTTMKVESAERESTSERDL